MGRQFHLQPCVQTAPKCWTQSRRTAWRRETCCLGYRAPGKGNPGPSWSGYSRSEEIMQSVTSGFSKRFNRTEQSRYHDIIVPFHVAFTKLSEDHDASPEDSFHFFIFFLIKRLLLFQKIALLSQSFQ